MVVEVLISWKPFARVGKKCYIACERVLRETSNCQTDIWVTKEFLCEFFIKMRFKQESE